jgi:hypothetical protein
MAKDKFINGCKLHAISDLDTLFAGKSAKDFIDYTLPKLPERLSHFKAVLPIQEENNFTDKAFYNGILLEFNPIVPEGTYFITAKSLD